MTTVEKTKLYIVLDNESKALEYGPAPDKDVAENHLAKLQALDVRGTLAAGVGRDLAVYELKEV